MCYVLKNGLCYVKPLEGPHICMCVCGSHNLISYHIEGMTVLYSCNHCVLGLIIV